MVVAEQNGAQAHYPYGESWYTEGTADPSVKRKFTSYRKETDSSLASGQINYAVARYHGARIGRFHRPDPVRGRIGNPQRLNRYAYVVGDPTNRFDPTGTDDLDGDGIDDMTGMVMGPDPAPCGGGTCVVQDAPNMGTPADAWFAPGGTVPFLGGLTTTTDVQPPLGCSWAGPETCTSVTSVASSSLGAPMLVMNTCPSCSSCICIWQVPVFERVTTTQACHRMQICGGRISLVTYSTSFSTDRLTRFITTITAGYSRQAGRCFCPPPSQPI
jgi:RHS repeat-associated protein